MDYQFEVLEKSRQSLLKLIEGLTEEEINKIPEGFNNNIAWNVIHVLITQQLICYKLAGEEGYVDEQTIKDYRKGTAPNPEKPVSLEEFEKYKEELMPNVSRIKADYPKFTTYNSYTTSVGISLNSIEDAITFNNYHEGIHLGYVMALRRAIRVL
ncbi:DinB family protein [Galbibacter sp. EGI 63066]|uniref:DinB family protein n=1 Tax=Galbibacter sp. EGI 63066 TaxID=2993559 RepID=UPI002248FA0C|nr:DinB family protein [Galbibacter sp. EGI 63066]MCX2680575.1 DinB family protein [Galbibacter sp. EGI 63066]